METREHDMEQRFVVFDGGSELRIYKAPLNQTARLINEFPNRKPTAYENRKDAKEAALAIINHDRTYRGSRRNILISTEGAATNDISELKERADKLARQIGVIQTEFRTGDVNTKIDDIGNVIKELRYDNDRLARENEGFKVSLTSLISAVEDSRFSDLSDTFQGVRDKMNAILETGRTGGAPTEAKTTARLAVVAEIVDAPQEGQAEDPAEEEPDRWSVPSGFQRTPGN